MSKIIKTGYDIYFHINRLENAKKELEYTIKLTKSDLISKPLKKELNTVIEQLLHIEKLQYINVKDNITDISSKSIEILQDIDSENPRDLSICSNSYLYIMHNPQGCKLAQESNDKIRAIVNSGLSMVDTISRLNVEFQYVLPVYIHCHGSTELSTVPYNDEFDSWLGGFMVSIHDKPSDLEKQLYQYNDWLNGRVYSIRIYSEKLCLCCNNIVKELDEELFNIYNLEDYIDILKNEYGINEAITRKAINDI